MAKYNYPIPLTHEGRILRTRYVKTMLGFVYMSHPVPTNPVNYLIDACIKDQGGHDIIKLALTVGARPIIDDQKAFFIAAPFEAYPSCCSI